MSVVGLGITAGAPPAVAATKTAKTPVTRSTPGAVPSTTAAAINRRHARTPRSRASHLASATLVAAEPIGVGRTHPRRAAHRQAAAVALAALVESLPGSEATLPAGIASDCSTDVSRPLDAWLNSLPAGSTWTPAPGACFQVDSGLELRFPSDLTINGGTFRDDTTKAPRSRGHGTQKGHAAIEALGGTGLVLENITIVGAHKGFSYRPSLAFEGGIQLDGTADATISNVSVTHTFGDGINLEPLRGGSDYRSRRIVQPVEDLTVSGVTIKGAGRQGITAASVDGATITNVHISGVGFDAFDFESDQANEGAKNVMIDGCTFSGINISMKGPATGPITLQNCTMGKTNRGDAVRISNTSGKPLSGPIVLSHDVLRCAASAYVSCFQLGGASDVTVQNTAVTIGFHGDALHESAYTVSNGSHVTFADDIVSGFGRVGTSRGDSTATVTGGIWAGMGCGGHAVCPAR
ncbi:MAG TPA: right-handed parallel beta-helix repeat-containing protein [Acidimicrobiales bacterium]